LATELRLASKASRKKAHASLSSEETELVMFPFSPTTKASAESYALLALQLTEEEGGELGKAAMARG